MIEVFKTDVRNQAQADMLIVQLNEAFSYYELNFDLDDCDNILRIDSKSQPIQPTRLIEFLHNFGCHAELLPDEIDLLAAS